MRWWQRTTRARVRAMVGVGLVGAVYLTLDLWQYVLWQASRWGVIHLWRAEYGRMAPW